MDTKVNLEGSTEEIHEKRRLPKAALFILLCILLEGYCTAGLQSILYLFFNQKIGYDADESTAAYHTYGFLLYCFPVVGSIIADSWLGRYKTMVCMTTTIAIGSFIIAVGVVDSFHLPIKVFSIIGLLTLTFGDGCLVALLPTFGADQYKSDEVKSIDWFFGLFYLVYNFGSIISRTVTPILREDFKCYGNDDCFPVVFSLPVLMMIVATVLVVIANRFSESKQAQGATMLDVLTCMKHAILMKFKSKKDEKQREHWLDYSIEKYGHELVWDTQVILKVSLLYPPITFFWALFYQLGSRWVYQATKMNGDVGFYTIKADQCNVANPLCVVLLIPVLDHFVFPYLTKIGLKSPLQKATLGGVLAAWSFLVSALIEYLLQTTRLHILWLIPQHVLMAMGEMMISIPLMNFSYSEAPKSMKTILQAFFFLAGGMGNLIVVIVAGSKVFNSQIVENIVYAVLMLVDMVIFGFLASRYKSVNRDKQTENRIGNS